MKAIKDIIDNLPKNNKTKEVIDALTVAYYRGAEHYKSNKLKFERKRMRKLDHSLTKFLNKINHD